MTQIRNALLAMNLFASVVSRTPAPGRPTLVAVDGVDGSGKTMFAARLAAEFEVAGRRAVIVHVDDFHNPRKVRYRLGRDSAEGYFLDTYDLAKLAAYVLDPLTSDQRPRRITTKAFDYRTDLVVDAEPVEVSADDVVIVEGMFLHRNELVPRWDLSIFLDAPFDVTVRRMADRDGTNPDPEHPSVRRYVEGQRHYLATCKPRERATLVVDNTDPRVPQLDDSSADAPW